LENGVTADRIGIDERKFKLRVDPARIPLLGGVRVENAPSLVEVQTDFGGHTNDWRLVIVEATSGELKIPPALAHLDPSGLSNAGKAIDIKLLDPDDREWGRHNRKWRQAIKLYQINAFLRDLDTSLRGGVPSNRPPTDLIFELSEVAPDAELLLKNVFGIRVVIKPKT
jgi:hypothetical protein